MLSIDDIFINRYLVGLISCGRRCFIIFLLVWSWIMIKMIDVDIDLLILIGLWL